MNTASSPRRRSLLLAGFAFTVAGSAHAGWLDGGPAGSGQRASESRHVTGFDAIKLRAPFKVRVRQTGREAVTVQADDNLLPLLETVVRDDRALEIGWKRGSEPRAKVEPIITVEVASLRAVAIAGDGDLVVESLQSPALSGSVSGSGDLVLDGLQLDSLTLSVAGSGDVRAAGKTAKLAITIAGSGDVKADALEADEVGVRVAGSGDAQVHAKKRLDVSIAGSGDVSYRGDAQLRSSVAGSGRVTRR
ncbi:head GIN domain-containing protein [Caldimonas sp. KR1-144]|uniref:head GIN domain-containing protein n=1 Tax=Caldimonas sp. KR1-144 TaxID=3400911 RepID=UPI003C3091A9